MIKSPSNLDEVACFLRVAESGSFTQAALRLGMPKSTVSRKVSALESSLGLRLFHRSTRAVSLTEAGHVFQSRCGGVLSMVEQAAQAVSTLQHTPRGKVRITVPGDFGTAVLGPAFESFLRLYPDIALEVHSTDEPVDLRTQGYDCAIRIGTVTDKALRRRQVGQVRGGLVATPAYLARRGIPKHPLELGVHSCLVFTSPPFTSTWTFARPTEAAISVPVGGAFQCNRLPLVRDAALAGLGIARLPMYMCREQVNAGKLSLVLTDWLLGSRPVCLCWPDAGRLPAKVRHFVDHLAEWSRTQLD